MCRREEKGNHRDTEGTERKKRRERQERRNLTTKTRSHQEEKEISRGAAEKTETGLNCDSVDFLIT